MDLPTIFFASVADWETWLAKHLEEPGIWLQFSKKGATKQSISYAQALDVALCYGWIDSQTKRYDESSYLQKFTPRRTKSMWSKQNREHIERLFKEGRMKPSGIQQVEAAKADGRWEQAYDKASTMQMPPDFLERIAQNKKAQAFFATLNKANTYAIGWRLQTAKKPETRERRMQKIIEMLEREEKLH